jgi:hypothetical protein
MTKVSCSFLGNPTNETVTITANTWGLLIANHLVQSLQLTNHTEPQSGPIYYSFWRCMSVLHLLPAPANYTNLVQKNQFPELNQHILTFLQQILQYGVTY